MTLYHRNATVMKVTMATAEQINDETVFVAVRRQGLPTERMNDGLILGTEADKFFDLPAEPISGKWFVLANATSTITGNAYDFQIRPAVYSKCALVLQHAKLMMLSRSI